MLEDIHKARIRARAGVLTDPGTALRDRLCEALPEAQALFGEDAEAEAETLLDMVFLLVQFLDGLDVLTPEIAALEAGETARAPAPELLAAKAALLEALAARLDGWTDADRAAWDALLGDIVTLMSLAPPLPETASDLRHSA